jgi:hypothetical protein
MERDTHNRLSRKVDDTVGEFKSAEMGVPHMPAWKAKTLGKLAQEKVLLEPRRRFSNSIVLGDIPGLTEAWERLRHPKATRQRCLL